MNRKEFITKTGSLVTLTVLGLNGVGCSDEEPQPGLGETIIIDLDAPQFEALKNDESWVLHPEKNVIIVNFDGEIRAFTSVCTHTSCSRNWVFGTSEATCTCHGSKFDFEGKVVAGPAQRDLRTFSVMRDGNELTIS